MDTDDDDATADKSKGKSKKERNTYIREDPEDIVDLADIKSIGNVLSALEKKLFKINSHLIYQIFYY